jgi:steroid delta-isomerase-like uncharacterized protein
MTTAKELTDQERIAIQRQVVKTHIDGECNHDYDTVKATFVHEDRSYFDCSPGGMHFDGPTGINEWYTILDSILPDLHIDVTHQYDTVGATVVEMTASGTHSADFAGVPASGRHVTWEAIVVYAFDEEEPDKLITERAYWDNDALIKQMKGEEASPLMGLLTHPRR